MADIAIVQSTIPTTTTTKDFTVAGFGTPKAALCILTSCVTNGTVANHGQLSVGATDGTLNRACGVSLQDNITLGNTVTKHVASGSSCVFLLSSTGTALIRAAWSSWVTDGVKLNFTVVDGTQYLLTVVLFGGTGISNAYVGSTITGTVIDTGVAENLPGFQPDYLITFSAGCDAFNSTVANGGTINLGLVQRDGSNPHTQFSSNFYEVNNATTTNVLASLETTRAAARDVNPSVGREVEIQDFTSSGFSAWLRLATGTAASIGYLAFKLSGIVGKVMAIDSPITGGSQQITGIGFTPQFGMLVMTSCITADSRTSTGNAEVLATSVFTTAAQYCHGITSDDGIAPAGVTNCETLVHNRPVYLRKDGGTFMDASFTSFGNGNATFNYNNADGTARKWAGLFIQGPTAKSLTVDSGSYVLSGTEVVLRSTSVTILEHRK